MSDYFSYRYINKYEITRLKGRIHREYKRRFKKSMGASKLALRIQKTNGVGFIILFESWGIKVI